MSAPRILVLSFSNLATDPRVNRQLRLLQGTCQLTAAGFADPKLEGVEFVSLANRPKTWAGRACAAWRLQTRQFERYYWNIGFVRAAQTALKGHTFDLIIANDADTWPLARILRGTAHVLFDAHEYSPREFEDIWWWRLLYQRYKTWLCRENLPHADGMLTVCPGIAEEYERQFGVRPVVVRNVPAATAASPQPALPERVRMIHHGGAARSRKIENMIRMLDHLDERFTLDLMLVGSDARYLAELRRLAVSRPRVRFIPPVPMPEIAQRINGYDIGLYLLEPNSFNNLHALPNKFFEFIQGRLAVAIGPSPEMARVVREHDCGLVASDFDPRALASTLANVTPAQIAAWKCNADRAARTLCWERESETLRREIDRLLAAKPCAA